MRSPRCGALSLLSTSGAMFGLALSCNAACARGQVFTVRDAIEMSIFTDPDAHYGSDPDVPVRLSPDGAHFAAVTTRGLIESNKVESTLWLFETKGAREALKADGSHFLTPIVLMRRGEVTNEDVLLSDLRWTDDSSSILFLQRDAHGAQSLYRATLSPGSVIEVSRHDQNVDQFDARAGTIVYTTVAPAPQSDGQQGSIPANIGVHVLSGLSIADIVNPAATLERQRSEWRELWTFRDGKASQLRDPQSGEPLRRLGRRPTDEVLALAPDGRRLITVLPVAGSGNWEFYQPFGEDSLNAYWTDRPHQYVLIDLDSGRVTPLLNAPTGSFEGYFSTADAVWAPDGRKVLLTDTYLALEGISGAERERRRLPCAAVVVEIDSGKTDCLMSRSPVSDLNPRFVLVHSISFGKSNTEVMFRLVTHHGDTPRTVAYVEENGVWQLGSVNQPNSDVPRGADRMTQQRALSIFVHQGLNEPPALVASKAGRAKKIWDPNPRLAALNLGEVSVVGWRDESGYEWVAGLVKPPDYDPSRRYPLVIQTHGFNHGRFLTDGGYGTALAARPLASVGIIVLQMDFRERQGRLATPQEIPDQVQGFNSAIEYLTSRRLVDPARVGIVGFSRTCLHVEGGLIANPTQYAAATIADGTDVGYFEYLLSAEGAKARDTEGEQIYGAQPFGVGLTKWIELAPSFNLDKIRTPVRLEVESGGVLGVIAMWPRYASLALQNKPVDFIYFPDGVHVLRKPLERLASEQGNVDWFRFWLQGFEDPTAEKVDEYRRWEKLCSMQVEQNPNQPVFCVGSKAQ